MLRREHAIIGKVGKASSRLTITIIFTSSNHLLFDLNFHKTFVLVFQNQQLWDLGLATADMEDQEKVDTKIEELDAQFDFVILAEFFDEGLVILARLLCWELEDVSQEKRLKKLL